VANGNFYSRKEAQNTQKKNIYSAKAETTKQHEDVFSVFSCYLVVPGFYFLCFLRPFAAISSSTHLPVF
jgi:hypothetical protein